jgi:hypothetical protein
MGNPLIAGDLGADWFRKFNLNDAALTAEIARAEAEENSLQTQIANLLSAVYQPPVGAYSAPTSNTQFTYSAKANPWTTATLQGRAQTANLANANLVNGCAGAWGAGAAFSAVATISAGNSGAIQFSRWTFDGSNNPSLVSTISIVSGLSSYAAYAMISGITSAVVVSATQVRLVYNSPTAFAAVIGTVTWDPIGLTLTWTAAGAMAELYVDTNGGGGWTYSGGNIVGQLVGTVSTLALLACIDNGSVAKFYRMAGLAVFDRNNTLLRNTGGMVQVGSTLFAGDFLGGGYAVTAEVDTCPADTTARITVSLNFADDYGFKTLTYLRINAKTVASNLACWAFSNTLAFVTWTDASSQRWAAAITINTAAGTLGLVNTYDVGNFNNHAFTLSPVLYNALNAYVPRRDTGNQASKFMRVNYNPDAAAGSELTSVTGNDIAFNTGPGSTTANTILSCWQQSPDVVCVFGFYATGPVAYLETWNMA